MSFPCVLYNQVGTMNSFILNITFFLAFIASSSTLCNGLMRKLHSETDPIALTCRKVTDFGFCVYTLRSDPRSTGADVYGLAQIAVSMLATHAKDTAESVRKLQKPSKAETEIVVSTCMHFYGLATNKDVPAAVKYLNAKAYGDAQKAASAVMTDGEGCQEAINKHPSPKWQILTSRNYYIHDLSLLSKDLIGLLN